MSENSSVSTDRTAKTRRPHTGFFARRLQEVLWGGSFTTVMLLCQSPLHALAIEDVRVLSRLGEPLLAEIPLSVAAGEFLVDSCFKVANTGVGGIPAVSSVRLTLSRGLNSPVLRIAGTRAMREPLAEMALQVRCPGVPTMSRTFVIMLDPPGLNEPTLTAATPTVPSVARPVASKPMRTSSAARAPLSGPPIEPGSVYRVRSGDVLSTVAARVSGRPDWSVWPIATRIYALNPGAFLLGDPNMLAQGSELSIPRLSDIDMGSDRGALRQPLRSNAATRAPARTTMPAVASTAGRAAAAAPVAVPTAAVRSAPEPIRLQSQPARIVASAPVPRIDLPTMQVTARLSSESQMKLQLRREGVLQVAPPPTVATTAPPAPERVPQQPPRPEVVAADTRAVLPAADTGRSWVSWLLLGFGLLAALGLGALASAIMLRGRFLRAYRRDLRAGLRRHRYSDALTRQREQRDDSQSEPQILVQESEPEEEPEVQITVSPAAAPVSGMIVAETFVDEGTEEVASLAGLDFELPTSREQSLTPDPGTVELPDAINDLDLEFPGDALETAATGQLEVDFDLLEMEYTREAGDAPIPPAGTAQRLPDLNLDEPTPRTEEDAARYYHLETATDSEDTPLPIELGEDEMGDQDAADKVVNFPKHSSR